MVAGSARRHMTELLIEAERHMTVISAGCMFAGVERPLSIQGSGWGSNSDGQTGGGGAGLLLCDFVMQNYI